MTNKNFTKVCMLATILVISGCQGAYKTTTGKPEPVLDMRAALETEPTMETISTGGIIMKRSYDPSWEMPKREADKLRAEFIKLQNELLALSSNQEQKINREFYKVENRVAQMRREEMRKAAKDAELMALVKSKFDVIDKNISFLKASEVQQISEKDALLGVLDDKFQAVDSRLLEMNEVGSLQNKIHKEEISMALQELAKVKSDKNVLVQALDKKFKAVEGQTKSISSDLKNVAYEQEIQRRLAVARKQAMSEAREMRLLEELALRKEVEEARLGQITAVVREAEKEKKNLEVRDFARAKEQAALEMKIGSLREKLKTLEVQEAYRLSEADKREASMKEALEKRMNAVKEDYESKFAELKKAQRDDLDETIASLKIEQEAALKEAEEYRGAIEERVFAMEKSTGVSESLFEDENIDQAGLTVGRIIESEVQVSKIDMRPASNGGIVGGFAQEDWMDLEDYQVVLHENNSKLSDILTGMLSRAEPYVGPWQVRWKLKESNMDVLDERFSLDVETDFDSFASYISNYMKGYRGFGLTFNIFRTERILVITD